MEKKKNGEVKPVSEKKPVDHGLKKKRVITKTSGGSEIHHEAPKPPKKK